MRLGLEFVSTSVETLSQTIQFVAQNSEALLGLGGRHMRRLFYLISALTFAAIFGTAYFFPLALLALIPVTPVFAIGMFHALQTKRAVLRNFPLLGIFRYFLESIRPEIQQYFIETETDGLPVPRETRSVVYQRAKQQTDSLPFGTQRDVYQNGYEWISHSLNTQHVDPKSLRVTVGGPQCLQP